MADEGVIPYSYEKDAYMHPHRLSSPYFRERVAEERGLREAREERERENQRAADRAMSEAMGPDYDEKGFGTGW
jgi:hypothetical protein